MIILIKFGMRLTSCFAVALLLLLPEARSLRFPQEDCNAIAIIGNRAKCTPYPTVEVMMDRITLMGKKLSTIKRLTPSHVVINQCSGKNNLPYFQKIRKIE